MSPWPGKCLAVASMPRVLGAAHRGGDQPRRPAPGRSPKDRVLMIGLAGLLLTSATGAKVRWTPTARPSSAVIRPIW